MDEELLDFKSFQLPTASKEQKNIVDTVKNNNIIINAVAGSGKTTTVCLIGKSQPNKKILLLTYNKRLKHETAKRVKNNDIDNVYVYTYHSFCCNQCHVLGNNDEMIEETLKKYKVGHKMTPISFNYDIIIIDEAQDLTPLYVKLIQMIILYCKKKSIFCVMGDVKQTIYDFNGADSRFLTLADQFFISNTLPWKRLKLSTSYRLTPQLANFINKCVLKEDLIIPGRSSGIKPRYIFCDAFSHVPIRELTHHYLEKFGYNYDDIYVLAPSIQSDLSPVKTFANNLSANHNIPIFIPQSDNDKIDSQSAKNKLVFATFHQAKGLERKCVILFGFDNSYYYYYNNDGNREQCPNEMYVALTRCSERMTIIHHYKKNFINFIDDSLISTYCYTDRISTVNLNMHLFNDIDISKRIFDINKSEINNNKRVIDIIMQHNNIDNSLDKKVKLSVTRLLSHITNNTINNALQFIKVVQVKNINCQNSKGNSFTFNDFDVSENDTNNFITENIKNDGFYVNYSISEIINENVSDIVGTAIPIFYEYKKTGKIPIKKFIDKNLLSKPFNTNSVYNNIKNKYNRIKKLPKMTSTDMFELVTIHLSLSNNLIHRINQINNYNFMNSKMIKNCFKRFDNHLKPNPEFEIYREHFVEMNIEGYDESIKRLINGYIDCIDSETVWEFKTVHSIKNIHILQLAIYAFLYYENMEINKSFKILNINDGEKFELCGDINDFRNLFNYVFRARFEKPIKLSDEDFIIKYK